MSNLEWKTSILCTLHSDYSCGWVLIRIKMHSMETGSETSVTRVGRSKTAFKGISRKYFRFFVWCLFLGTSTTQELKVETIA